MKISYNWLKNYIDVDVKPKQVETILTDCGLEVEGYEEIQSVKGGLEGLVIGEVLFKEKHPDADRLNLTKVDVGNGESLHIVCGAPNVEKGQKVVVATVGTTIYPTVGEAFQIKKSKIRGQLSEGMICAEDEIGLGDAHDGIMILDEKALVGTLAKDYFKVENDVVFEIGLTPNRADATGHIGVARDLVTVLNLSRKASLLKPSVKDFKIDNKDLTIDVEVVNPDLCPRYSGVTISNVSVQESPDWLKNRLRSIGLKPINNVVDVTNFVLHETGQPLHAFDAKQVKGNKVVVQTVADKSKFTTLDEEERTLSDKDLMICNAEESMCIAGVFGGIRSGVSDATQAIFLESAYFNPVSIRKTAKHHGLNTDASFRYERGADPNITIYALKRAANLIKEVAGGEISSEIIDVYPNPIPNFEIVFSYENCNRLIGEKIDKEVIKNILAGLEITIISETEEKLKLSVPPFKVDVQREVDVIEEVLRIYGYNQVELPKKLASSLSYRQQPDKEKVTNLIAELLVSNGFSEILSNSLTKESYYTALKSELVYIANPLSNELEVLRQSMLFNGLETIVYNQNRKSPDLKLFELGKTYLKKGEKFQETNHLSLLVTGMFKKENWNTSGDAANFYHLKGTVNALLNRFGLMQMNFKSEPSTLTSLSYGLKYSVNNIELVQFGRVDKKTQQQFAINNEVFYAIFNFDNLMKLMKANEVVYKEVPKYPIVRRDLALLLDQSVNYSEIEAIAFQQERKLLKEMNLFDVYEGKNLEKGKKSYAVSFVFQDEHKTLTDKQIDKMMNQLIQSLTTNLKAQLR
ncbi:MAG: phenylalanine--tRNA ligase subunit beta [Vicingus serpentipes]|nr:phenylalanine--tRNA ligase subunit beta [Vicingus serpentipes]